MTNGTKLLWLTSVAGAFLLGYSANSSNEINKQKLAQPIAQVKPVLIRKNIEETTYVEAQLKQDNAVVEAIAKPMANDLLVDLKQLLVGGQMVTDMAGIAQAYGLVKNLSEQELLAVLNLMTDEANNPKNLQLVSLLTGRLATFDPMSAIGIIEDNITAPQAKMTAMLSALSSWTKEDPIGAYHWYTDPNNGNNQEGMYQSMGQLAIFNGLATNDTNDAFTKLTELGSSGGNTMFAAMGFSQSLESKADFINFIEQASELDDNQIKESLITAWVQRSPLETVEWLETVENKEQHTQLQTKVFHSWMASDPSNAADWFLTAASDKQSRATKIIQSWGMGDPNAALSWLDRQSDFDKEQPTAQLLNSSVYSNSQFAIDNLELLSTDKAKESLSSNIYRKLFRSNSRKAAEFLASSPYKSAIEKSNRQMADYKKRKGKS